MVADASLRVDVTRTTRLRLESVTTTGDPSRSAPSISAGELDPV